MPVIVDPLGQDLAAKAVVTGRESSSRKAPCGQAPRRHRFCLYKAPAPRRESIGRIAERPRAAISAPAGVPPARIASARRVCYNPPAREAAGPARAAPPFLAGDEDPYLQQQSAAGRGDLGLSRPAADPGQRAPLLRHGGVRRDPRERPRRGRFRDPVDLLSGQRPSDGAAGHARRAEARLGAAGDGGHPLLRLCPAGPQIRRRARRSRPSWSPT